MSDLSRNSHRIADLILQAKCQLAPKAISGSALGGHVWLHTGDDVEEMFKWLTEQLSDGPSEAPAKVLYVATAYRWGWANEHQYTVYVGADKAKALSLAANEPNWRGGKYGCQVMEWAEDKEGEQESKQVGYFPSIYGEKRLHHNWRLDYFEKLGHVLDNAADGSVWLPEDHPDMKDREGKPMRVLKPHAVKPPDWLLAERDRAKEFSDAMTKFDDERYATDESGK